MTNREKMMDLVNSFHSLQGVLQVWDEKAMETWASSPMRSTGERLAAQFVLEVWNCYTPWECGKFDLFDAVKTWDSSHWRAFVQWAQTRYTA